MQLGYEPSEEEFRSELVTWLEANVPSRAEMAASQRRSTAHMPGWARRFQRAMYDDGWLVPGWPPRFGGRDASPVEQMIYFEELARRGIERAQNPQGLSICTPSIVERGTEAQIERYGVPTLKGELTWCLGMSEPGAGSDLAALTTKAVRDGDEFVVSGQKVWTSGAHDADLCMAFVRTDADAPKHKGISTLIIDMSTLGIECRPLLEITEKDHADFNEVFFDDVRVPAENLLGELNTGWEIANTSLGHERAMLWINQATNAERTLGVVREMLCPIGDAAERDRLASAAIDVQAMWLMGYQGFAKAARGRAAPEHSILKLYGTETQQRLNLLAVEALGPAALDLSVKSGVESTRELPWMTSYFRTFGNTIAGGTSEIQRNIIAERILGLPRR